MFKYKILAIFVVIIYFSQSFFLSYGGIGADSLSYFEIASDFPNWTTNLFPPVYPLVLRVFYLWIGDYFWAYKIIDVFLITAILGFSWVRKFFFKETVLLFTGKSLFMALNGANSESLFVFLLYFLLYFIYQFRNHKIPNLYFVVFSSILMILLVGTRYSGVFLWGAFVVYFIWGYKSLRLAKQLKGFVYFIVFSFLGISIYLLLNYYQFGSLTGENIRGGRGQIINVYLLRDLLGIINVVNPFIGIKPSANSLASLAFQIAVAGMDIFLLYKFVQWYKKNKTLFHGDYHILLWIITIVYSLAVFFSGLSQQIEEMNVRMLMAGNFTFFFSCLILYYERNNNDKFLYIISCFFLSFLMMYSLKTPDWFLGYKKQITPQVKKFKSKKYLYNNEKSLVTTTIYQLPFSEKTWKYLHTNRQIGELKQTLIGTINPQIKWLKYDTLKDKSKVLYTSELNLKMQ